MVDCSCSSRRRKYLRCGLFLLLSILLPALTVAFALSLSFQSVTLRDCGSTTNQCEAACRPRCLDLSRCTERSFSFYCEGKEVEGGYHWSCHAINESLHNDNSSSLMDKG